MVNNHFKECFGNFFMIKRKRGITQKVYKKLKKGENVKCRYDGCDGLIKKIDLEIMPQYSEFDEDVVIETYCCSKRCLHNWKILVDKVSKRFRNLSSKEYLSYLTYEL